MMSFVTFPAAIDHSAIDYLSSIRDPQTGANLYTFEHGTYTLDVSLARTSASYLVPGSDSPFDPFGTGGFPLDKRVLTIKWLKRYRVGETHSLNRINLHRAVADGRQVQLVMLDALGREWIAYGKMTTAPTAIVAQTIFAMEMTLSFELNPPIFRQLRVTGAFYWDDVGVFWDTAVGSGGFNWDSYLPSSLALTAQSQSMTITNTGDAIDSYGVITVTGPFPAFDIQLFSPTGQLRAWMSWYGASFSGLAATDSLTIDLGMGSVKLNGTPAFDSRFAFRANPYTGVWPGDNTLAVYGARNATYNSGTANGTIIVDFRSARW